MTTRQKPVLQPDHFYLIEGHVLLLLNVKVQELILRVETQEPLSHIELLDSLRHIGDYIPHTLPEAF